MHPTFTSLGPEYPRPANTGGQRTETAKPPPAQREFSATILKLGSSALAQVIQTTPASDAQRQRLIKLYTEVPGSQPQTPSQDRLTQLPARLQSLLQSPSLALVELKLQGQLQLALATAPLKAGQTVEVRQTSSGALQIVTSTTPSNANTLETQGRLTQALKTALPQHAQGENLSGQLGKLQLLQQLIQSQPSGMDSALKQQLLHSLKQVLQQPASAQQLSQPEQLKQQLTKSGPAMESQLKGLLAGPTKSLTAQPSTALQPLNDKPLLPATPNLGLKANRLNTTKNTQTENHAAQDLTQGKAQPTITTQPKELLSNDLKALLLASLQLSQAPLSSAPTPAKTSELDQALAKLLAPLLQRNTPLPSTPQDMTQLSSEKLLALLQHQLQKMLGRVQLQQLQALNKRLQSTESGPALQHLQLELPVRHGTELYSLTIHIDEEIHYQEKEQDEDKQRDGEREQVRQWQVKLAFDLPQGGRLHAHLSIINESVNASLWAEDPQLLSKAREHLAELRERMVKDGLEVKNLDCFAGSPPLAAIELRYNLVDIKT